MRGSAPTLPQQRRVPLLLTRRWKVAAQRSKGSVIIVILPLTFLKPTPRTPPHPSSGHAPNTPPPRHDIITHAFEPGATRRHRRSLASRLEAVCLYVARSRGEVVQDQLRRCVTTPPHHHQHLQTPPRRKMTHLSGGGAQLLWFSKSSPGSGHRAYAVSS